MALTYQQRDASVEELNTLLGMSADVASRLDGYANSVEQLSLENPENFRSPIMQAYADLEINKGLEDLYDSISETYSELAEEESLDLTVDDVMSNISDYFDNLKSTPEGVGESIYVEERSKIYPEASRGQEVVREEIDLRSHAEANLDRELRRGAVDSSLDRAEMLARQVNSGSSLY